MEREGETGKERPHSPREARGAGRGEETRDSMGERGRGENIAEVHLQSPTLCDGHVAKIKTDIIVPPLPAAEASGRSAL